MPIFSLNLFAANAPQRYTRPRASLQVWLDSGASMPCERNLTLRMPSVSPSVTVARPTVVSPRATRVDRLMMVNNRAGSQRCVVMLLRGYRFDRTVTV